MVAPLEDGADHDDPTDDDRPKCDYSDASDGAGHAGDEQNSADNRKGAEQIHASSITAAVP